MNNLLTAAIGAEEPQADLPLPLARAKVQQDVPLLPLGDIDSIRGIRHHHKLGEIGCKKIYQIESLFFSHCINVYIMLKIAS